MNKQQAGFTLIELVMVIVILGILAATAIPKYVDLRADAANATAEGVLASARAAASINFAKSLLNNANTLVTADNAGATHLRTLMDIDGQTWTVPAGTATITSTIAGTTYTITVATSESIAGTAAPATLTKSW